VKSKADNRQYGKYRLCIDELEKVVHLLLMLSGRLARLHNTISCLEGREQAGEDNGEEQGEAAAQQNKVCFNLTSSLLFSIQLVFFRVHHFISINIIYYTYLKQSNLSCNTYVTLRKRVASSECLVKSDMQ